MRFLSCPEQEALLEYVSIPGEISAWRKARIKFHMMLCDGCRERIQAVQSSWQALLTPEPNITSSMLRVYSRLQKDETLILKGWKLDEVQRPRSASDLLFRQGWLFRGGLAFAMLALLVTVIVTQMSPPPVNPAQPIAQHSFSPVKAPVAQFREQDRNTVKVHYVQPELLESMEFETTSAAR